MTTEEEVRRESRARMGGNPNTCAIYFTISVPDMPAAKWAANVHR